VGGAGLRRGLVAAAVRQQRLGEAPARVSLLVHLAEGVGATTQRSKSAWCGCAKAFMQLTGTRAGTAAQIASTPKVQASDLAWELRDRWTRGLVP
jgi:hypothetical protein